MVLPSGGARQNPVDGRLEPNSELVVAGGHRPVLLEAADSARNRVPDLVVLPVARSMVVRLGDNPAR